MARQIILWSAAILVVLHPGAAEARAADSDLASALAQIIDTPSMPREAATLEGTPYRMLLDKVAVGPDERTLINLSANFTRHGLANTPDSFRGKVVFTTGVIAQVWRVDAPGVGRLDRNAAYAGIMGVLRRGAIRLWAFRALRRPHDAMLYAGDRVHLSGYFMKNTPMLDANGKVHWMPLLVAPWPTYYGKWMPKGMLKQVAPGLLPASEVTHEKVRTRPVVDFLADGSASLNGVKLPREELISAMRLYASRHPERAVVARLARGRKQEDAASALADTGLGSRVAWKTLPDKNVHGEQTTRHP